MIAEIFKRERFEDADEERAFHEHSNGAKFQARRVFLYVGTLTYASYSLLDYLVAGEAGLAFVALRLVVVTPIMLAVSWAFWRGYFAGRENLAFAAYATPVVASIIYMCLVMTGPIADIYPVGMLVLALFVCMVMLPSFWFTVFLVAQVMGGLFIITLCAAASVEGLYTLYYFLSLACTVLLVGMFFLENTERRQYLYKRDLEKTIGVLRESKRRAVDLYHEAKQAENAKNEFLAVVSHELRTPMNAIIGFSEIISKGMLGDVKPPHYQEYAVHIHDSGHQLLNIINDILDISRAEMGKITFEKRPFDMAGTFDKVITTCRANANAAGIDLVVAESRPQDLRIDGDESRLRQAMTNIIDNAIKFSTRGDRVAVALSFTDQGGLNFSVADNGIGISKEDIEQIRQPFQQAESAFARNNGGLGLGLAICTIVTSAHDSDLTIDSTLGKGTTVSITMPPDCILSTVGSRSAA